MPPMGYWGWRPLLLCVFLSVWVVGCTDTEEITPEATPTWLPPITLTLRGPDVSATAIAPILPTSTTLKIPLTVQRSPESPLNLRLHPPTCYETLTDHILCLGEIENRMSRTVQDIVVEANLFDSIGRIHQTRRVIIQQRILPPGGTAPYDILFNPLDAPFGAVIVNLFDAETTSNFPIYPLFSNQHERLDDGRYRTTIQIENSTPLHDVQVVVTIYDTRDQVMGYRITEFDQWGTSRPEPIEIDILPQITDTTLYHKVYISGWRE